MCKRKVKILSNITLRFRADFAGLVLTPKSSIGNIKRYFFLCHSFPIRRNSVLSGFSFSLFVNIHDWTEARRDCKPLIRSLILRLWGHHTLFFFFLCLFCFIAIFTGRWSVSYIIRGITLASVTTALDCVFVIIRSTFRLFQLYHVFVWLIQCW